MRALWLCLAMALSSSARGSSTKTAGVDWSVLDKHATQTELFGQPYAVYSKPSTKAPGILNATFWRSSPLTAVGYRVFVLDRWWARRNASAGACAYFPNCVRVPMVRGKTVFTDPQGLLRDFQTAGIIAPNTVQLPQPARMPGLTAAVTRKGALRSSATAIRDSVKHLATNSRAGATRSLLVKSAGSTQAAPPPPASKTALDKAATFLRSRLSPLRRTSTVSIGRVLTHIALLRLQQLDKLPGGPLKAGEAIVVVEDDTAVGVPNAAAVLEKALSEQRAGWDMTVLYGGLKACRAASPDPTRQLGFSAKAVAPKAGAAKRNVSTTDPLSTAVVPINTRLLSVVALAYSSSAAPKVFQHLPANASLEYWLSYMLPGPASAKRKPPALDAFALCNFRLWRPSVKQVYRAINEIGNNEGDGSGKKTKKVVKEFSTKLQASSSDTTSWWSSLFGKKAARAVSNAVSGSAQKGSKGDGSSPTAGTKA